MMQSKSKRILAAAMYLCLSMPLAASALPQTSSRVQAADGSGTTFVQDDFVFTLYDDHAEVYATMTQATGELIVPAEVEGLPVTAAGEHAFAGVAGITSVVLPDTITSIGKQAFWRDTALTSVTIPDGVTEIADEAFLGCSSLTDLLLPKALQSIGVRAFYDCKLLGWSSDPSIVPNVLVIPAGVQSIGASAFENCSSIAAISLPEGLTELADGVFWNTSLTELTLPESVKHIGARALPDSLQTLIVRNPSCTIDSGVALWSSKRECTIVAHPGSYAQEFANEYGYPFRSIIPTGVPEMGDVSGDGKFSVLDVVMVQKYLLGVGELSDIRPADFNGDGILNGFDLALMKRELLANQALDYTANDLMTGISANFVAGKEADEAFVLSQTEFALDLMQRVAKNDENVMISPYSIMQALAMTANGADGTTRAEMEQVLGGIPMEQLNAYLYTQRMNESDPSGDKLSSANSIWYRDDESRLQIMQKFLQTNADYYGASAFREPFDNTTVKKINNWANQKTDGMIPEIMQEIDESAVIYLMNAVVFDAKWKTPYTEYDVVEDVFTANTGDEQTAEMMCSMEHFYLEDENATGFLKPYQGKYAFAALLPDEGVSIEEYLDGLTAESLHDTLANPQRELVSARLPKFSYDYDVELNDVLAEMGMPEALTPDADFSQMADTATGALWISKVQHTTHIDVFEEGTKAAAITVIEATDTACPMPEYEVILDRPFVYCIVDTETSLPIFIGTVASME